MDEIPRFFPDARSRTSSVEFRLEDGLVHVIVKARQEYPQETPAHHSWTDYRVETTITTEQFAQAASGLLRQATREVDRG